MQGTSTFKVSKTIRVINKTLSVILLSATASVAFGDTAPKSCPDYLNHSFKKLHSTKSVNLCELYTGKPLLIVNTASHCGYTKQFGGLESLYQKFKDQGFEVVGFASDDFKQAAKSEREAATICYKNYGVTFTMLSPTSVKGGKANAVFNHLNSATSAPAWNFNKYLVTNNGHSIHKFDSDTTPLESDLEKMVQKALNSES